MAELPPNPPHDLSGLAPEKPVFLCMQCGLKFNPIPGALRSTMCQPCIARLRDTSYLEDEIREANNVIRAYRVNRQAAAERVRVEALRHPHGSNARNELMAVFRALIETHHEWRANAQLSVDAFKSSGEFS